MKLLILTLSVILICSCNSNLSNRKTGVNTPVTVQSKLTNQDIEKIACEAYNYGNPLVDNYRFLYARCVDKNDGMYVAPINTYGHEQDVKKAGEKAVQTVNGDTPYSRAIMDLRTEPIVLTLPTIDESRYFTMQFVDMYTQNFAYIGNRTTGNDGGNFLITGPGWKGENPKVIKSVISCETELMTLVGRTQLLNPMGLPNIRRIQAGYQIQPLSQFLSQPAPPAAVAISWLTPMKRAAAGEITSADIFGTRDSFKII